MRALIRTAILTILLCIGAATAQAGPWEDGLKADQAGDYVTAAKVWRQAADQGHASAQFGLGAMYADGQGVPQDYVQAVSWYRKAADQGHANAQYNLGVMYDNGQGVPQDYVQAHKWFNLAASRFTAAEAKEREQAVKNRDIAAKEMTPAQIAEAQKLAREWKPK